MTDKPYTPTTARIKDDYRRSRVWESGNGSEAYEKEFDRWFAAVEAAAEQRGAIKALRRVAKDLEWLGAQGNIPTPDTSWQGVLECIRIINSEALTIEYRADQMEGDE